LIETEKKGFWWRRKKGSAKDTPSKLKQSLIRFVAFKIRTQLVINPSLLNYIWRLVWIIYALPN